MYAESYYLGTIFTGAVSGGWCARSPSGERLAWNFTDGILPGTLYWANLFDLYTIHQPIPLDILGGGLFSAPAFAPDNLRLAFSACLAEGCGVYILHLETGALLKTKAQGLSSLQPMWSPTGDQVAAVIQNEQGTELRLVVLDTTSGAVTYTGPFNNQTWTAAENAPIYTWGVQIPRGKDGFSDCGSIIR